MDKYLSIITNFGCHYKCPYCIVKTNNMNIPATTLSGLDNLKDTLKNNDYNIVSLSGGGDPLHNYDSHKDWYDKLFTILNDLNIPLEMHTNYLNSKFPYSKCKRVVYHLNKGDIPELINIKKTGNEIIRVVFVVTKDITRFDIMNIWTLSAYSKDVSELSFRQMVNENYEPEYYHHDFLQTYSNLGFFHYIEQNDYNCYYVNGKCYNTYKEIGKED